MEDNELDRLLDTYKVADADKTLEDHIVAAAKLMPANENARAAWLRRGATLMVAAVMGFWLGNVTIPTQTTTSATAVTSQADEYFNRMIMGPGSLSDMGL